VGKQVARILYSKNARVYVAARSEDKATRAIEDIRQASPESSGELIFLLLDLADLSTIRASAQRFLDRESQLHVLFNNAGVMQAATSDVTAQGYELQLGVNNIGPFLFTKLLTPTLAATAKASPPGSVRVVWVGSLATESPLVPTGGVDMSDIDNRSKKNAFYNYVVSKAGNYLHAVEYARRHESDGIVSIPLNPGNLSSDLWRWQQSWFRAIFNSLVLHPPVYGAYTELFAALSPSITMANTGQWGEYLCASIFFWLCEC
jgi:retinol dehydrogenase 12